MMALTFRISNIPSDVPGEDLIKDLTKSLPRNSTLATLPVSENTYLPEIYSAITMWPNEGASCYRHIRSSAFISARSERWNSTIADAYDERNLLQFHSKH